MTTKRYIPIIQKPYCCAMACLSMILYRRIGKLYDQEELAVYFGVQIDDIYQEAFAQPMPILTSHNYDEGVKTIELAEQVQEFFQKENIPLSCLQVRAGSIENLDSWIQEYIDVDADIWCEYVSGDLLGGSLYLHDGLIESYDRGKKEVTMMNPEGMSKNRFNMSLTELSERISGKYSRETGFLVIREL